LEIAIATIEDLAFGVRSSREPDGVGRRGCLSGASSAAAEKSERRMALKIRLGARLFPKTNSELFAISFVVYYDIILKGFKK
jgi:hypothetical protein